MPNMLANKPLLIIIGGPTASGKTSLAIEISREIEVELVNADSMQVYRSLDIGTNKGHLKVPKDRHALKLNFQGEIFEIKAFDIEGCVSWMFDVVDPGYNFTLSHYQSLARAVIDDIQKRGKIPVLVGGTGLYIDSIVKGYTIHTEPDPKLRADLETKNVHQLQDMLISKGFSLDLLNASDRGNPRRLIRHIEKLQPAQKGSQESKNSQFDYKSLFFYPKFDMAHLEQRIKLRAKKMIDEGFVQEVQKLLAKGYSKNLRSLQSTGYKQVIAYLDGKIASKEDLISQIALAHRQYAKRQITWFEGASRGYKLIKVDHSNIQSVIENFLED